MDKEIIFFLIFVAFSILSSLLNRKKKRSGQSPHTGPDSPYEGEAPRKKPFSFEDILKELEGEVTQKRQPQPEREVVIPETTRSEQKTYEGREYRREQEARKKETVYETYEGTSYETIDEKVEELEEEVEKAKRRADHYELEKKKDNPYAKILNDPDGLRQAFIMKEILDRKHF